MSPAKPDHPPTYRSWVAMRARCSNPKHHSFARYGGRGIAICKRWESYGNFLADMGERPTGTSIDRYPDKNGDYEPGNCRWATPKEQASNTRRNRMITWAGETMTMTETERRYGMNCSTLRARLRYGWSLDRALLTPSKRAK